MPNRFLKGVLWSQIIATKGGSNRLRIILNLKGKPANTSQLSKALDLHFSTITHHLRKLEESGIITKVRRGYGATFALSEFVLINYDEVKRIRKAKVSPS